MHLKRPIDITLTIIALILCMIPMLVIAIYIKIDSYGPALFKQQRVGKNGVLFNIYKFRTMHMDSPNVSTEDLGDPSKYLTRIGRFLRKTSLDELPQLFNILKGDMSLVGPRPALFNQYELIMMRDKFKVNSIRPGLTGYAQVMGRDFISDEQKVEYDRYYLENMKLMLDLKIIIWTVNVVLRTKDVRLN